MRWTISLLLASRLLAVSVTTARQDNNRTSANTSEIILTPANIVSGFGRLRSLAVDGPVYAQPLYVPGLTIGGASHDTLFAATLHNSVYAFDARTGVQLWTRNLGTPLSTWPNKGIQNLIQGDEIGIVSTPVIDEANSVMYVVCAGPLTLDDATWVLFKLNLLTGAVIGSGVSITGSFASVTFAPRYHLQRTALTLEGGIVYVGFGSYSDLGTYQGWIMAYTGSTMTQSAVLCLACGGGASGAGVWQSGAGIAAAAGKLYLMTGNGTYDGITKFGVSFVRLSATLTVEDWFTPANNSTLNSEDWDMASGVAILDPNSTQVFGGSKSGVVFNLLRSNLGHLQGGGGLAPQSFLTKAATSGVVHTGIYGGMFMNNVLYQPWDADKIYAFTLSGTTFNTTPVTSAASYALPGAVMTGSSNGSSNQIIWATTADSDSMVTAVDGVLRAFNTSLTQIYASSGTSRDTLGTFVKFAAPTVADGMVFVATQDNAVRVYGLLTSTQTRGLVTSKGLVTVR